MTKPIHIKKEQGTYKEGRAKTPALKDNLIPLPPEGFNELETSIWITAWEYLRVNGISQSVDYFMIQRYCILISLEQELAKQIKKKGGHKQTITNKKGESHDQKSGDFIAYLDVLGKIEKIEKVIGIGPLWRDGINMKPGKAKSKFDDI